MVNVRSRWWPGPGSPRATDHGVLDADAKARKPRDGEPGRAGGVRVAVTVTMMAPISTHVHRESDASIGQPRREREHAPTEQGPYEEGAQGHQKGGDRRRGPIAEHEGEADQVPGHDLGEGVTEPKETGGVENAADGGDQVEADGKRR